MLVWWLQAEPQVPVWLADLAEQERGQAQQERAVESLARQVPAWQVSARAQLEAAWQEPLALQEVRWWHRDRHRQERD